MRLDARTGDSGWRVWDCRQLKELKDVVWIDDEINMYGSFIYPIRTVLDIVEFKVEKILIIQQSKLVLINPVEDEWPGDERKMQKQSDWTMPTSNESYLI